MENCAIRVNSRKSSSVYFSLFFVAIIVRGIGKNNCSVQDVFQLALSFCSCLFNFKRKVKRRCNFDNKNTSL